MSDSNFQQLDCWQRLTVYSQQYMICNMEKVSKYKFFFVWNHYGHWLLGSFPLDPTEGPYNVALDPSAEYLGSHTKFRTFIKFTTLELPPKFKSCIRPWTPTFLFPSPKLSHTTIFNGFPKTLPIQPILSICDSSANQFSNYLHFSCNHF